MEAARQRATCGGIILLSVDQEKLRQQIAESDQVAILTFPLKKGILEETITRLLPTNK